MFEDGNLSIFVGKCTKFWLKKKNSPEEPGRVQPGGEDEHHDVIYKNKKNKNFFFLSQYSWNYYAFVKFGFIGTIIIISALYGIIFYLIPIMLS